MTPNSSNPSNWTTPPPTESVIEEDGQWHRAFSSTIAAILIVAALVAILGNAMVLTVIVRHRGMRTRTNLFLVNLAIADLLVGILLMPFSITTMISDGWIFGDGIMCQFNGWMNSFCLITSIHTLMYIGIHKYFSIVHPLSKAFQLRTIIFLMSMAWIWAGICSTMNVWGLEIEYKPGTSQCGPKYPSNAKAYIIHVILQLTVMIVPFFILVFCYTRMFIEIKKHSARLRTNSTVEEEYILATQKKVAVTLFIVLAFFFLMALPYVSYATYTTVNSHKVFPGFLNPVAYMFLYLNSMVNPIIYAFRSPAFREGYKEILCQTPNYVISDDSDFAPRTHRLASLVSNLRRGSNASISRLSAVLAGAESVQDLSTPELKKTSKVTPVPPTPTSLLSPSDALASKRAKLKKTRRKSLFDLLKATRQSNAQSVVHRNGDMIIMKGGKIVSVHRQEQPKEKNELLDRLTKLAQTVSKNELKPPVAVNGEQTLKVPFQLEIPPVEGRHSETVSDEECSQDEGLKPRAAQTEATLQKEDRNSSKVHIFNEKEPQLDQSAVAIDQMKLVEEHQTNQESVSADKEGPSAQACIPVAGDHSRPQTPDVSDYASGYEHTFDFPGAGKTLAPAIFINLDDEDHVTGVIPLSPVTQEHLERATQLKQSNTDPDLAMSLQRDLQEHRQFERQRDKQGHHHPSRHNRLYSGTSAMSRSSEDITSMGPRMLRLPSLEYLDPPSRLWASNSSASLRVPSFEAWKKQLASARPQQGFRSRLLKLHLPSMRRMWHAPKQENSTQL